MPGHEPGIFVFRAAMRFERLCALFRSAFNLSVIEVNL
jgi:hypothetical protein